MSLEISDLPSFPSLSNFDLPSQSVNVASDVNAGSQGSFGSGVSDFFSGLAGLFTNGVNIFKSVAGQYAAAQQIAKETINPTATTVQTPGASLNANTLIKIGLVVGIGALALYLIRKK